MSESVDKLLEGNREASDKHRLASNIVSYNTGVDHCIEVAKNIYYKMDYQPEFEKLIQQLEQLKKPL